MVTRDWIGLELRGVLGVEIDVPTAQVRGWMTAAILEQDPGRVRRLLLEAPVAALLARRAYAVVHAGAVCGPAGAIVIRGAPGAGKSTLVAAAHCAGLAVLGDESVLVARDDPDELLAGVRDITLTPAGADILGLRDATTPHSVHGEMKYRLDLPDPTAPRSREARRRAVMVLGPRTGRARLEPLPPESFRREFDAGAIPQEDWGETPPAIAAVWASRGAYRLSGTEDLAGAVALVTRLATSIEDWERL
jgi:hypothetical protein